MKLTLAGSGQLTFLPLARKADISLKSTWPHPSFEGAPAPLDPVISDDGFTARWSVLEINRSFGQSWYDGQVRPGEPAETRIRAERVGVTFYEPVDVYQRNYRAVHYAVLLIAITFLTFFLWEHLSRHRHPRHAVPHGRARAGVVLSIAAGTVGAPRRSTWPTACRRARSWR